MKEDGVGTLESQTVSGNKTQASITRALVNYEEHKITQQREEIMDKNQETNIRLEREKLT